MLDGDFPARLLLALKALSLSRGRLAVELAVDKSVVSRWLSGHQAPTGENLANLTAVVAARRPGFTLLDWEADLEALSARLGVAPERAPAWGAGALLGLLLLALEFELASLLSPLFLAGRYACCHPFVANTKSKQGQ